MATLSQTPALPALVQEFISFSGSIYQDQWARMDIAATIHAHYGSKGLHSLSDHSGYAYSTLKQWVNTARYFKHTIRQQFPDVSPATFQEIRYAVRKFSPTTRASRPSYWLNKAGTNHWHSDQVRHAVAQRILVQDLNSTNAETVRNVEVQQRAAKAHDHLQALEAAIAQFNVVDAPYALVCLQLTKKLYQPRA